MVKLLGNVVFLLGLHAIWDSGVAGQLSYSTGLTTSDAIATADATSSGSGIAQAAAQAVSTSNPSGGLPPPSTPTTTEAGLPQTVQQPPSTTADPQNLLTGIGTQQPPPAGTQTATSIAQAIAVGGNSMMPPASQQDPAASLQAAGLTGLGPWSPPPPTAPQQTGGTPSNPLSNLLSNLGLGQSEGGIGSAQQTPPAVPSMPSSSGGSSDAITAHNNYRSLHRAPALQLSDQLNSEAQQYAQQLANAGAGLQHSGVAGEGENLAEGCQTVQACVDLFYQEGSSYDYTNPVASHFTQLIWVASQNLGVGTANDAQGNPYWVFRYTPAGNVYPASNFEQNVLPSN